MFAHGHGQSQQALPVDIKLVVIARYEAIFYILKQLKIASRCS